MPLRRCGCIEEDGCCADEGEQSTFAYFCCASALRSMTCGAPSPSLTLTLAVMCSGFGLRSWSKPGQPSTSSSYSGEWNE